ncbi:MAG: beta-N-acetylhexosaminidase [Desulfobacteraceae bacterium 4572_87]|nr:MAG: beta-N-acetylhexosaminidase [Desulfobacteraceae bacterium 4572_87]
MHSTLALSEFHDHVGRLFMAGMPGPRLDAGTISLIRERGLGGIILFKRNIVDPLQVATLTNDLQETALKYHGLPLFLAVDQEGGRVARLREPFTRFPGNSAIGHGPDSHDMAARFGRVTAMEMRMVGLNMDMAPVLDVPRGPVDQHLQGRMFGEDPGLVGRLGRIVVNALQENGVMAVGKHFPGLGKARLDPHEHLPTIEADQQEIETINLPSFQTAIREGVSAVMTSHALYPGLDSRHPATLSYAIITELLRKQLGFKGLIITDDLEMGAIKKDPGVAEGAVKAFEAGNDILLICEDQRLVRESMDKLINRLLTNEALLSKLHESVDRVMAAKEKFLKGWEPVSLNKIKHYFKNKA